MFFFLALNNFLELKHPCLKSYCLQQPILKGGILYSLTNSSVAY